MQAASNPEPQWISLVRRGWPTDRAETLPVGCRLDGATAMHWSSAANLSSPSTAGRVGFWFGMEITSEATHSCWVTMVGMWAIVPYFASWTQRHALGVPGQTPNVISGHPYFLGTLKWTAISTHFWLAIGFSLASFSATMTANAPRDPSDPPPANGRLKIILGVDYGTTFTGISFVTSDKTSVNDIDVLRTWPGNGCPVEGNWKTPSVIAYKSENPSASRDRWGYEVRGNMASCSWTKLLLDKSAETAEFDDPSLRGATGGAFFCLPPGKTAEQVCQDYLTQVYDYVVENLKQRMTPEVFNITPIECYLTIPAIWTDNTKNATRQAALNAGFGSRPLDTVRMITEPEAAAIATLKYDLKPGSVNEVKVGDNILVLDCGGGTVVWQPFADSSGHQSWLIVSRTLQDITTYSMKKIDPILEFDEICVGAGTWPLSSSYLLLALF